MFEFHNNFRAQLVKQLNKRAIRKTTQRYWHNYILSRYYLQNKLDCTIKALLQFNLRPRNVNIYHLLLNPYVKPSVYSATSLPHVSKYKFGSLALRYLSGIVQTFNVLYVVYMCAVTQHTVSKELKSAATPTLQYGVRCDWLSDGAALTPTCRSVCDRLIAGPAHRPLKKSATCWIRRLAARDPLSNGHVVHAGSSHVVRRSRLYLRDVTACDKCLINIENHTPSIEKK